MADSRVSELRPGFWLRLAASLGYATVQKVALRDLLRKAPFLFEKATL